MKLASRSAMLSLSSAKAGSRAARGNSGWVVLGVVWEARRLVREGGRRGVVGREGRRVREVLRARVLLEGGLSTGVVVAIVFVYVVFVKRAIGRRVVFMQGCPASSFRRQAPRRHVIMHGCDASDARKEQEVGG